MHGGIQFIQYCVHGGIQGIKYYVHGGIQCIQYCVQQNDSGDACRGTVVDCVYTGRPMISFCLKFEPC